MPRNLTICCDGTNNQFGRYNTSIVRLVQSINSDSEVQRLYYDPGVGTLPEPGLRMKASKKVSEWMGLAFGIGLTKKFENAYVYLMDQWEPGDRVFLFGFSRRAYTVRVLAALLHSLGLLHRGNHNLMPYLMRLFSASRDAKTAEGENVSSWETNYWKLSNQFRGTFARSLPGAVKEDRRFPVHFLGCWDTVASVGWVYNPKSYPFTRCNPSIAHVRHALAIDERRWFFRQNEFIEAKGQDLQQLWFAGVHADVGGGYPESESGLWREPFGWMIAEAETHGLILDRARLHHVLHQSLPPESPWNEPKHESLTIGWWPCEYCPKYVWDNVTQRTFLDVGRGRYRNIEMQEKADGKSKKQRGTHEVMIHSSTLKRIRDRDQAYVPPNLCEAFLDKIRKLETAPDAIPYCP